MRLLDGLLVIDLTRVLSGPFCTMLLADLGARVVKVEPPEGDEARRFGPFVNGHSAYFASVNRGKEGVVVDARAEAGAEIVRRLADRADVLVENSRPGALDRLGLGREALRARNPRLVYASLSGFGQTGPYAGRGAYDIVIQAMAGLMGITGQPGGEPTRVGASLGDIIPALYTAIGILAALHRRGADGAGRHVDVGMMDCVVGVVENAMARFAATGRDPEPIGNRHPTIAPFGTFRAADGPIVVATGNDALFGRLCATLGLEELSGDPRFATNEARARNVAALAAALEARLATAPAAAWEAWLVAAGVPVGRVNRMSDLVADPQLRARNMIATIEQPGLGSLVLPGIPIKAEDADDAATRPAPALGEHTAGVLRELLGLSEREVEALVRGGAVAVPTHL